MTYTIQTRILPVVKKAQKTKEKEVKENTADGNILNGNIQELLSICDSLNNLYEKLSRLEYLIRRKNIEINLIENCKGENV